jgi:hypothetical protein
MDILPESIPETLKKIEFSKRIDNDIGSLIKTEKIFEELKNWYRYKFESISTILDNLEIDWENITYENQDCYILIKFENKRFLLSWNRMLFKESQSFVFLILQKKNHEFKTEYDFRNNLKEILRKNLIA